MATLKIASSPRRACAGEGQSEGDFETHNPDFVSLHQWLDGVYSKGFVGQWQSYAINGAFSILAGTILLILPVILDSSVLACAGAILAVRGTLALASTFSAPMPGGLATTLLSSLLYISAGICLMLVTFTETSGLILFFSLYFFATGITTILFAALYRRQYSGHWEWLLVSGVLNLDLALITLSRLPEHFNWVLTIFLGLDFIAHGSALLVVALNSNDDAGQRSSARS
jgi:uncharacterized membrane protein HdeD (DUF308 family)